MSREKVGIPEDALVVRAGRVERVGTIRMQVREANGRGQGFFNRMDL